MKTIEIPTAALSNVTGGCAACGNPAHSAAAPQSWAQNAGQQAAQWGAKAGAAWARR